MKFIEALVIICITMLLNVAVLMMLAAFRIHPHVIGNVLICMVDYVICVGIYTILKGK